MEVVVAIVLVAQLLPEVVDPLVVVVLVLVVVLPLPQVVDCWVPDLLVVMRVLRLVQVEAVLVALLLQVVQVELVWFSHGLIGEYLLCRWVIWSGFWCDFLFCCWLVLF